MVDKLLTEIDMGMFFFLFWREVSVYWGNIRHMPILKYLFLTYRFNFPNQSKMAAIVSTFSVFVLTVSAQLSSYVLLTHTLTYLDTQIVAIC